MSKTCTSIETVAKDTRVLSKLLVKSRSLLAKLLVKLTMILFEPLGEIYDFDIVVDSTKQPQS